MLPSLNDWVFPDVIDASICKAFKACDRKGSHKYFNGLHMKEDEESVHLVAGRAIASGCEETRNRFYFEKRSSDVSIESGLETLLGAYGPDRPDEYKNHKRLEEAFRAYWKKWPLSLSSGIVPIEAGVENTFSFELPILHPVTGKPLIYAGKRDMIGREMDIDDPFGNQVEGELWGIDEKTCGYVNEGWQHDYELEWQFLGYTYYERMVELNEISGVIIRRIGLKRAKFDLRSDLKDAKIRYTSEQLEDWYNEMLVTVNAMVEAYNFSKFSGTDISRQNFSTSCNDFTGCEFKSLCTHSVNVPDYQIVRWNPLKREM